VAAHREPCRLARELLVEVCLGVVLRHERDVVVTASRGVHQVVATHRLGRGERGPAHAQVALHGAGHAGRRDHLTAEAGVLGVELHDAVHVRGGTSDVDDDGVPRDLRQQLDAGQDDVGRRALDHGQEVVLAAQVLPADDVGEEELTDGGARPFGSQHSDAGHDVGREDDRVVGEELGDLGLGVHVARDHDRTGPDRGEGTGAGEDRPGVAAVGPAGQQHDVGLAGRDAGEVVPAARREHRDHLPAAGQGHPASGLGGHQLLVAHHGDPQSATRARARQRRGIRRPWILLEQPLQARVVPVEDVGVDRRAVLRGGHDATLGKVDQRRLGERRAEVDADDRLGRGVSRGHGPGPRGGRRCSRCRR
jgi:hypothetical protein